MIRSLLTAAVLLIASGCAGPVYDWDLELPPAAQRSIMPSNAARIRLGAVVYRRVTGSRLRQAIVGKGMFPGPGMFVTGSGDGRFFHPDGRSYRQAHHRSQGLSGTYSVSPRRVCTTMGSSSNCFALFRSEQGAYLIHPGYNQGGPTPVELYSGAPLDNH